MRSFIFFVVVFTLLAAVLGAPVVHQRRRRRGRRANTSTTSGDTIDVGDTTFSVTSNSTPNFEFEDIEDDAVVTNDGSSTTTSDFALTVGRG